MLKKLLSLLVALCMVLALAPAALAADAGADGLTGGPARETGYLEDQPHADLDFEDMKYTAVSEEEMTEAIEAVRALIGDAQNAEKVEELFKAVAEKFMTIRANIQLLKIYTGQDTTNEENAELFKSEYALYLEIFDPFLFLVQDILKSPCKDYFVEQEKLTQDDIDSYLAYGGMSEEEKALNAELSGIEDEYWAVYFDETLDEDGFYKALGEVYMHALTLNNALVKLDDSYDNYVDYAYENEYERGYDVETARKFTAAVRENIVPLCNDMYDLYSLDANSDFDAYQNIFYGDYTGKETLDAVRPYMEKLSPELLEAWDYMIDHGLYDIEAREGKTDQGFTTRIDAYGSPFFLNCPGGYVVDFTTLIHEFGHYNNAYWHASGWNDGSCSMDVAEVHSQSLELLFTQYYGDFFGDMAPCFTDLVLYRILGDAIINGSLYGELEIYAYTTPDVTVDMISEKYVELCEEYGEEYGSPYEWLLVHHLTTQPMYYISYATSGIGALCFYAYALENGFDAAVDRYLDFVSQSPYDYFQDQFEAVCGVDPLDPAYVAEIVDTLYEDLDIENRANPVFYSDVDKDDECYGLVTNLTMSGVFGGFPDGTFRPDALATRAEAAQMLFRIFYGGEEIATDYFADDNGAWYETAANWCADYGIFLGVHGNGEDLFCGDNAISRQELTTVFCRVVNLLGLDTTPMNSAGFADADQIADWAVDSMEWYYENDMLLMDDSGNINPKRAVDRYTLAKYANNIFYVIQTMM